MSRIAANHNLINNQHFLVTFKLFLRKCLDIKVEIQKENFLFYLIVTKSKKNLIIKFAHF